MKTLLAIGCLAMASLASAVDVKAPIIPDKEGTPKIHTLSVTVNKPAAELPPDLQTIERNAEGTVVRLAVNVPKTHLIGLNPTESKLEGLTDDKKTDLTKAKAGAALITFVQERMSANGETAIIAVRTNQTPAPGAAALDLNGFVTMQIGTEVKSEDAKDFTLNANDSVMMGNFTLRMRNSRTVVGGKIVNTYIVTVISPEPNLGAATFADADGKEIKILSSTRTSPIRGQTTATFTLEQPLDKAKVSLKYYTKVESIQVPFQIRIGLGL